MPKQVHYANNAASDKPEDLQQLAMVLRGRKEVFGNLKFKHFSHIDKVDGEF
jgi:hypothetical protein